MAISAIYLMLTLATLVHAMAAQFAQTNQSICISLGSSIRGNQYWLSPSGHFAFGFYPKGEGFAIGVWLATTPSRTVVWTADRDGPPIMGGMVELTPGGSLRWMSDGGEGKSISDTYAPAASAAMLDTGNFVLYDASRCVIWSTFGSPTDTLLAGQSLSPGNQLFSSVSEADRSTGRYRLNNQEDGNLVLYPVGTADTNENAYWSTATYHMGLFLKLWMEANGTLLLVDKNSSYTKALSSAAGNRSCSMAITGMYYRATLDFDGILRLYSHAFFSNGSAPRTKVEWAALPDRCSVNGVCGPNSVCRLNTGGETNCSCLPSFEFLNTNKSSLGCWRASRVVGGCSGLASNEAACTMVEVKGTTWWVSNPYSIEPSTTGIEECGARCLADCSCEVAMFSSSTCSKEMLPLRYGKMVPSGLSNTTLFIKVCPGNDRGKLARRAGAVALISGAAALAAFSVAVFLASVLLLCCCRRFARASLWDNAGFDEETAGIRSYSFHDLEVATDGFAEELGRGAFGAVFKGALATSATGIAVKRLEKDVEDGEREFQREVRALGRTHHRNLVRLLGFCNEGSNRLLVYEYMPNGSLASLLFKPEASTGWSERVRIAIDIARGLRYLHDEIDNPIIHFDIKPENILVDSSGMAKIADFGLAKVLMASQTMTFTGVRGTQGYLAPEWSRNAPITVKADVYSYGVVLLEIVSGRRSMGLERAGEECNISEWVYECVVAGEVGNIACGEGVDVAELDRMAKVGVWCTQNEPATRPMMKDVVLMLEGNMEVRRPPPPASFSQSLTRVA